jgi:DNA repair protein RadA/Sms
MLAQLEELSAVSRSASARLTLEGSEFNRVLCGGIVPGSVVLLGGDPGIGKSTLLLQLAAQVARSAPALYVCGEESPQQVRLRADRLGIQGDGLLLLPETSLSVVLKRLEEVRPVLAVVDSLQTLYVDDIPGTPGSINQMREGTLRLAQFAKSHHLPLFLVGHVTKDGAIAGPRVVEHMVDVVLYLEGERTSTYRLLRGVKNRFGSTDEVGVFEMADSGLVEVANPSAALLAQRPPNAVGSAVVPLLEGTRPLLVEVQALTTLATAGPPRRVATGIDFNRLLMLIAVLTQRVGITLGNLDVIVNVVGGLRIHEPAADLAVALAIASSVRNVPVNPNVVALGEVGLSGELRGVSQTERRLGEAATLGFSGALVASQQRGALAASDGLTVLEASTLRQAVGLGLTKASSRPE